MRIIESIVMTNPKEIPIKRHWLKQMFLNVCSWNPCNEINNSTVRIINVPSDEVIINEKDGFLIMHPETARQLRKTIETENRTRFDTEFYSGVSVKPDYSLISMITA